MKRSIVVSNAVVACVLLFYIWPSILLTFTSFPRASLDFVDLLDAKKSGAGGTMTTGWIAYDLPFGRELIVYYAAVEDAREYSLVYSGWHVTYFNP